MKRKQIHYQLVTDLFVPAEKWTKALDKEMRTTCLQDVQDLGNGLLENLLYVMKQESMTNEEISRFTEDFTWRGRVVKVKREEVRR